MKIFESILLLICCGMLVIANSDSFDSYEGNRSVNKSVQNDYKTGSLESIPVKDTETGIVYLASSQSTKECSFKFISGSDEYYSCTISVQNGKLSDTKLYSNDTSAYTITKLPSNAETVSGKTIIDSVNISFYDKDGNITALNSQILCISNGKHLVLLPKFYFE